MALNKSLSDREYGKFCIDESGNTAIRAVVASDWEIGAVELKDGTTDTRAKVKTDGTDNALVVTQNSVPQTHVDIVTPLGDTAMDDTNDVALVGVKGSVGYDNTNNLFRNRLTDGTNFMPTGDTDARAVYVNLGANNDVTVTGTVTANAGTDLNTSALATSALQLPDGHNVTVDNAVGAAAVNIQDGGNSITVDGTFWQATQPISGAVTTSGTATTTGAASDAQIGGVFINGGDGTESDTSVTLTTANTAYQLPASPPASPYLLILYNASDSIMYLRFSTGTTLGCGMAAGQNVTIDMGASTTMFAYCASAGKIMNVSSRVNY